MSTAKIFLKARPMLFDFTALLLGSLFLLTSCQAEIKSVAPTPNPNPKEIYEITVTVENAPGEFISAKGEIRLEISGTWSCLPLTSFSGVPSVSWGRYDKVNFKRTARNTFSARVILDRYIPHDDYGKGLCEWDPGSVSVNLHNGINIHTASIAPQSDKLKKRVLRIEFFNLKRSADNSKIPISNWPLDASNEARYPPSEYFYIVMTANRVKNDHLD